MGRMSHRAVLTEIERLSANNLRSRLLLELKKTPGLGVHKISGAEKVRGFYTDLGSGQDYLQADF